jgi:hypothetical protein
VLSVWTWLSGSIGASSSLRFCSSPLLSLIIFSLKRTWRYRNNLGNYFDHKALFE